MASNKYFQFDVNSGIHVLKISSFKEAFMWTLFSHLDIFYFILSLSRLHFFIIILISKKCKHRNRKIGCFCVMSSVNKVDTSMHFVTSLILLSYNQVPAIQIYDTKIV